MSQRFGRAAALALVAWILIAGAASAANLSVTSLADNGAGTLREALTTAEGNGEADVISFAVTGTVPLLSTLPTITTDVEIQGPGAALLTLSGGDTVRVFRIEGGTVAIRDLTIADGFARGGDGADATVGLRGGGGGGGLGAGGGLYSANADLTLDGVVLSGNRARGGDGGDGGPGTNTAGTGSGGDGGASSLGSSGGSGAGTSGNGGGGGGAGAGFADGGDGGPGNAGGGGGLGGFRMLVGGLSDVGNGSGGSGNGCGGGSPGFQIAGDFAGDGGHGIQNCAGTGGGGGAGAGLGGGLYLRSGTLVLTGVTFDANEARRGGGGAGGSGGGDGQGKGGAMFVDRDGNVTAVTGLVLSGNVADDDAGTCDDNDDLFNRGTYPHDAPTGLALDPATVLENQPPATLVGAFATTDASAGAHTYALVTGAGSTDNAQFSITGDQLFTNATFDHETQPTRSIRVRTTNGCGQFFEAVVSITVGDINEPPVALSLSPAAVPENQPPATTVGGFTTTDPEGGAHFYALVAGAGDGDNGDFAIAGSSLVTFVSFDHETQPTRSIRVRTTDGGGLFLEQAFTVTVTDVNEAPTVSPAAFSLAEDSPLTTVVGTVTASDPDAGTALAYSITAGNVGGAFAIDSSSGAITVAGPLDFETTPSYSLTVRATDDGVPALFDEATVTVTVTDVNEAPTVSPAAFSVPEDSPPSTAVGTVTASDPDAGDTLTYSITAGNVGGAFAIDSSSGAITVAGPLDRETTPSYSLTVRATDDAVPALFGEATATVTVTNVNETPVPLGDAYATAEDEPLAVAAPGLLGNDGDPDGDMLTVVAYDPTSAQGAAVTVAADGALQYDPTAASALQALDDGDSVVDTFSYAVEDPGGLQASAVVEVTVSGASSGLTLAKDVVGASPPVVVGSTVTYRLSAANSGPGTEAAVVVTDPLPAEVTFADSACAILTGGTVQWAVGDLAAGASATCDVEVSVVGTGTVVNTASATSLDLPPGGEVEATATFQTGIAADIPTLGWPGLALLAALLAALGWWRLRAS